MLSNLLVKDYKKLRLCLCFKNGFRKNIEALSVLVFNGPLLLCGGLLRQGSSTLATGLDAYFILSIALVLRITSFIRHRKIKGYEKND